jgi:uncharacterized protein (DUF2141 family)
LAVSALKAQSISVEIKGIRSEKGQLCIAIFADEASFKAEKTLWEMNYPKTELKNGEFKLTIPIKAGKYGLSVLDDENKDGKMNYNILRIPQEGFGFSNYFHRGIKFPEFKQFSFFVEKNEISEIKVVMKYL